MKKVVQKLGLALVGSACCVALLAPSTASAADQSGSITQLKLLQILVKMSGDSDQFGAGAKAQDYVTWARNRGVNPDGGWKPGNQVSADVLAKSLVQLYGLNARKYGGDNYKTLEREGIVIDSKGKVDGKCMANLCDNPEVYHKGRKDCGKPTSPPKPPHGHGHGHGHGDGDHDDKGDDHGKGDGKGEDNGKHDDKGGSGKDDKSGWGSYGRGHGKRSIWW